MLCWMYQNLLSLNTTSYSKAISLDGDSSRCDQGTTETNKLEAKPKDYSKEMKRKRVRWCEWFRNVVFHKNEEFRSLRFLKKCKNCKKSNDAKISIVRKFAAKKKQPWKRNLRRFSHQFFLLLSHRRDATLPALSRNTETFFVIRERKTIEEVFFSVEEKIIASRIFFVWAKRILLFLSDSVWKTMGRFLIHKLLVFPTRAQCYKTSPRKSFHVISLMCRFYKL